MISDGAIRVGELHFAGVVPDEGDYLTELEGKWGIDGTWIHLRSCRSERVLRQRLQASQTEVGGQDERREMRFAIGLSGDQKGQGQRRTSWTRRRISTHAAVGRIEDACGHDDDTTRRWKSCGRSI